MKIDDYHRKLKRHGKNEANIKKMEEFIEMKDDACLERRMNLEGMFDYSSRPKITISNVYPKSKPKIDEVTFELTHDDTASIYEYVKNVIEKRFYRLKEENEVIIKGWY